MTRISTLTGKLPPTRSISFSWSTRRSRTWASAGSSPISSRNRVPPWARSMRPRFWASAPVKAPFSYPNNSLSRSVGGMAPQFTLMNGVVLAGGRLVDGIRDHLLARAGLPEQQHGAVQRRDLAHQLHDPFQTKVGPDDVFTGQAAQFVLEVAVVVGQKIPELHELPVSQAVGQGNGAGLVQEAQEPDMIRVELFPAVVEHRKHPQHLLFEHQVHDHPRQVGGAQPSRNRAGHRIVPQPVDHPDPDGSLLLHLSSGPWATAGF